MNIHAAMGFQVKVMCKLINCSSPEKNPPVNSLRSFSKEQLYSTHAYLQLEMDEREKKKPHKTTEVTYKIIS